MRFIAIAALVAMAALDASAQRFANETLHYVVSYKWGLVHKDAGEATLSLRNVGNDYRITLTAKTKRWADRFFPVRDTLVSVIRAEGLRPLSYSKISHEDGAYTRDDISYSYHGNVVLGAAKRHRIRKNGTESRREQTLSASGRAFDFLSVFYYLRTVDFESLTGGRRLKTSVFSGSMTETLTIRCLGKETLKLRSGERREAYKVSFTFTSAGGSRSSEDIEAWVSTDANHTVLQLVGQLPVGQVRVYLV